MKMYFLFFFFVEGYPNGAKGNRGRGWANGDRIPTLIPTNLFSHLNQGRCHLSHNSLADKNILNKYIILKNNIL